MVMNVDLLRTNTLASSYEARKTPLFQALADHFSNATIEPYIHATKTGVKKSKPFLAVLLIIRDSEVVNSYLYQVKHTEGGKIPFQVKAKYDLSKLRLVNGMSEDDEHADFELAFEKAGNVMTPISVKWTAQNGRSKKNFLMSLWKVVNEHGKSPPQFLNVNYNMLQDSLSLSKTLKQVSLIGAPSPETKEYKYLTGEEERDLEIVTEGIDWAVENAENFMQKLMNELSGLDKANIHSIMSVENDVTRLFTMMDHALHELCRLEDIMTDYEGQLNQDRTRVESTLKSYTKQQIRNDNTTKLLDVATELLDQISFSETTEDILQNLPLKSANQISRLTEAVLLIQEKSEKCRGSPLIGLSCVEEQSQKMEYLLRTFGGRVIESMSEITSPTWNAAQSIRHSKLVLLLPVVSWLAQYDPDKFIDLASQYQVTAQSTYAKNLKEYFDDKRNSVTRKSAEKLFSKFGGPKKSELALAQKIKSSTTVLNSRSSLASQSNTSLDSLNSAKSELDFHITQHGNVFETSVRDTLDFVELSMIKEEGFINQFFGSVRSPAERRDMAAVVLCRFSAELESFVHSSCKFDLYYALPIYLSLLDKLDDTDSDTYLFEVLRSNLDTASKYFNSMHKQQKGRITEPSRKSHRGTAESVKHFTQYLLYSESLRKQTRRSSLDTSYKELAVAVSQAIETFAGEQTKAPCDVVIAENYHHIYHFLFRNKIESLGEFRSKCHKKYKDHLELYVRGHLGSPLDRINLFFEGVQLKINSGVPHEEIGFYPEFSKQKVKALTSEYTVKEIRKGLESIMKKIEKHFTKDQNLFKMACLTLQAEFIKKLEGYENLLRLCYPDSGIRFMFNIIEIHAIFDGKSPKH